MKRVIRSIEPKGYKLLTPKQKEVYELRENGLTFREIAERFGITPSAARCHYVAANNWIQKCDCKNLAAKKENEK